MAEDPDLVGAGRRVMLCASMKFVKDIVEKRLLLAELGFAVSVPLDTELMLENPDLPDDLDADLQHCLETNQLLRSFELVAAADAVLVLNHPKNDVEGYIGTSVLMELAVAAHAGVKIFLLHAPPSYHDVRWAHEVAMLRPVCLGGDARRLPNALAIAAKPDAYAFTVR